MADGYLTEFSGHGWLYCRLVNQPNPLGALFGLRRSDDDAVDVVLLYKTSTWDAEIRSA
ncbi:Uncharacterised protein [Vibrio cholerae]|nr:Uncharacterised protein [Vibrio cholerae]